MLIGLTMAMTSCSYFGEKTAVEDDLVPEELSSVPFPTKVPTRFSAQIVVTTYFGGKGIPRETFVARDGTKSVERFGQGEASDFSMLYNAEGEAYRIDHRLKTYTKQDRGKIETPKNALLKSMTSRWLNEKRSAVFKDLGVSNGIRKYEVEVDGAVETRIVVYIDEELKFPVKQEVYSIQKDSKDELVYSVELKNISTEPKAEHFEIPKGYVLAEGTVIG